jgi:HAD superfamily hydrolase (TIGR01509 family)
LKDLVIFDCDGVIVDSERISVAVEARILTELGWPHTSEDVIERWMGRSHASQLGEISEALGPELARLFDERSVPEVVSAFRTTLTPVEGIEVVLDKLDLRGVPTCVASSGTPERIELVLGLTGMLARFEGRIFSAAQVKEGKPAPDLFHLAAKTMRTAPSRCAVVEDSVNGVKAAVAAGMTVYGFAGGLSRADRLADAGAVTFSRMSDLVDLLELS